jgi:hypothetical protein
VEREAAQQKSFLSGSSRQRILAVGILILSILPLGLRRDDTQTNHDIRPLEIGGFAFEKELMVPGSPDAIYDAITGDISGWWDHKFSATSKRLYIEPKPGGGFYEIFDDAGNGARHATVIYADRGKRLRMEGPLGFSGSALHGVYTYEFEAVGSDSTRLKLSVHMAGEVEEGWAEAVEQVWEHFLVERFKPYIESRGHQKR